MINIWSGCCLYSGVSYHPLWFNRLQGNFSLYVEAGWSILIFALCMYYPNILCEKISSLISSRSLLFKQIFRSAIRKQKAPNGFLTPLEETLRWSFVRFYILHAIHGLTPKGELRLRCYSYNLWDTPGKPKHWNPIKTQFLFQNPTQSVISHMLFLLFSLFHLEKIMISFFPFFQNLPPGYLESGMDLGNRLCLCNSTGPSALLWKWRRVCCLWTFFCLKISTFAEHFLQTWRPSNGPHQQDFQPLEICQRKTCKSRL